MKSMSYCVKEKKKTESIGPFVRKKNKRGQLRIESTCASCGSKKSTFVKGSATEKN